MDHAARSVVPAPASTVREFELYRLIVKHYHVIDINDLAARLELASADHFKSSTVEESAATILIACRYSGLLEQLPVRILDQIRAHRDFTRNSALRDAYLKFDLCRYSLPLDVKIAVAASPDKKETLGYVTAGSLRLIEDPSTTSVSEFYKCAISIIEECSALAIVLGDETLGVRSANRRTSAELAFDCAFFKGLPIHLFHPRRAASQEVDEWVGKVRDLTQLGRANLALHPYEENLSLLAGVNSLFVVQARFAAPPAAPAPAEPVMDPMKTRDLVFISYSRRDQRFRDDFLGMLGPIAQTHGLSIWSDREIEVGALWKEEIEKAIARARIAVLLVSPDFLNSSFIRENELPPLLAAAERGGTKVFWVACRHSNVLDTEIGKFQGANLPEKPLSSFDRRDARERELQRISQELLKVAKPSH